MKSYILLENMSFFAHHGVMEQETKVGNVFTVNLRIGVDLLQSCQTDQLADTVSYADIHASVRQEMDQPSKLLENVAYRIVRRLRKDYPAIQEIDIKLSKRNPPIGAGAQIECATIHLIDNLEQ